VPSGPAPQARRSSLWLWSSPEASQALRTRDLATILRTYRRLNRLSQDRLAQVLGFDKTYISMIETRRRVIADLGNLRHIAHTLAIPGHALGVTESGDATFAAMMQFAGSVLTLAEVARKSGHATDAVNELWPLVARLEARAAEGFMERDSLTILGRARLCLGVALGTLLPDEKLTSAAKWTGQALIVAERLDLPELTLHALTMHGNELRKAGRVGAAIARLQRAVAQSTDATSRATACAMLARAAGEARRTELFDTAMRGYRLQLDRTADAGMLTNEFTFREIHLRGLVATGRAAAADRLMSQPSPPRTPAAPQWAAIERITTGDVLLAVNERASAAEALLTGLSEAEMTGLPHQAQRAHAIANSGRLAEVAEVAHSIVTRLQIVAVR